MEDKETKPETGVGEIRKRRETMADGRRYIIYYTFGETELLEENDLKPENEVTKDV